MSNESAVRKEEERSAPRAMLSISEYYKNNPVEWGLLRRTVLETEKEHKILIAVLCLGAIYVVLAYMVLFDALKDEMFDFYMLGCTVFYYFYLRKQRNRVMDSVHKLYRLNPIVGFRGNKNIPIRLNDWCNGYKDLADSIFTKSLRFYYVMQIIVMLPLIIKVSMYLYKVVVK